MVLKSTHNLRFGAKIRKIGIPCISQFCYIKVGYTGVYIACTCTCFHDMVKGEHDGLVVEHLTESRGSGHDPHMGHHVSLRKTH